MDKIHDYIIRLKLDSKAVKSGVNKEINSAIKEQTKAVKGAEKVKKAVADKEEARLRKELALLKSKTALEKTANSARRSGIPTGHLSPLRDSKRKVDLDTAEFKLRQKVLNTEEKISAQKKAQATRDAEDYRIWQLRQEGEERRAKEADKEAARARAAAERKAKEAAKEAARARATRDAEDYRIWQLRQEGEERRAKEAAKEAARARAAAERKAKSGFQYSQQFANMQQGISDARGALRRSGGDPMLDMKLSSLSSSMATAKTRQEIAKLSAEYRDVSKQVRQFTRDQAKLNKELSFGAKAGNKLAATITRAGLQLASFYAIMEGGRAVFNIGKEFESMEAGLLAASNSSKEAKENFEFLRKTSMNLGRDITSGAKGFNRIAAAMKKDFSVDEIRATFTGIQEASATYALNKESSDRVLVAMGQIAAKGKFMREEFQNQLGDSLSIGWEALERATGLGQRELGKMMEAGQISSEKYMIPFINSLREIVRENDALEKSTKKVGAQQQRFFNALKLGVREMFNSGGADSLSKMFEVLTRAVTYLQPILIGVGQGIMETIKIVFSAGDAIASLLSILTGENGDSLGFWNGVNRIFSLLAYVIWEAIAGVYVLKDLLSTDIMPKWLSDIKLPAGEAALRMITPTALRGAIWENKMPGKGGADAASKTTTVNISEMKVEANNAQEFKNSFLTDIGM